MLRVKEGGVLHKVLYGVKDVDGEEFVVAAQTDASELGDEEAGTCKVIVVESEGFTMDAKSW
jgi:hypothetical protein